MFYGGYKTYTDKRSKLYDETAVYNPKFGKSGYHVYYMQCVLECRCCMQYTYEMCLCVVATCILHAVCA